MKNMLQEKMQTCALICEEDKFNVGSFQIMWQKDNTGICGLVVRVPGCRPRGSGFDFQRYQIFWVAVGLEQDPLSLMRINEELLERKN
jgi:hypothetical protein